MIQVWSMTDAGLYRKENQDAYAVRERTDSGHTVCVVCDGMGGSAGGQMASRIAADTFLSEIEKLLKPEMTPEQLREILRHFLEAVPQLPLLHDSHGQMKMELLYLSLVEQMVRHLYLLQGNLEEMIRSHIHKYQWMRQNRFLNLIQMVHTSFWMLDEQMNLQKVISREQLM